MDVPKTWRELASQFRKIEIGWPKLRANWTSSQWDASGEQCYLSGVKDPRIQQNFRWAAERGAVLHRGRGGPDAWLYWLDLLRLESPRYGGSRSNQRTDDPEESEFGQIENVCLASAEYCFKLGTKAIEKLIARTPNEIELRNAHGRCYQTLSSVEALALDLDLFVGIGNRRRIRFLRTRTQKFALNCERRRATWRNAFPLRLM